jgi:hypothetical protein
MKPNPASLVNRRLTPIPAQSASLSETWQDCAGLRQFLTLRDRTADFRFYHNFSQLYLTGRLFFGRVSG